VVVTVLLLVGSAALIYIGCEFFVNGVEWVGRKLGIAQNAVGTILAAFGGPLLLATISYGLTGCAILLFRRRRS
jgi:cation:H+ antiporter